MKLKRISLYEQGFGEDRCLAGKIEIEGIHGDVTLRLDEDHCQRVLAVVADMMLEETRNVAECLTSEIIGHCGAPELITSEVAHYEDPGLPVVVIEEDTDDDLAKFRREQGYLHWVDNRY